MSEGSFFDLSIVVGATLGHTLLVMYQLPFRHARAAGIGAQVGKGGGPWQDNIQAQPPVCYSLISPYHASNHIQVPLSSVASTHAKSKLLVLTLSDLQLLTFRRLGPS